MNLQELGYYLYMENQEKKAKEKQSNDSGRGANSKDQLNAEKTTTNDTSF